MTINGDEKHEKEIARRQFSGSIAFFLIFWWLFQNFEIHSGPTPWKSGGRIVADR
jgi:hypothetical protein